MPIRSSVKSHGSSRTALERARLQSQALREARATNRDSIRARSEPNHEEEDVANTRNEDRLSPLKTTVEPCGGFARPSSMATVGVAENPLSTAEGVPGAMSADHRDQLTHGTTSVETNRLEAGLDRRISNVQEAVDRMGIALMEERKVAMIRERRNTEGASALDKSFKDLSEAFASFVQLVSTLEDSVVATKL